MTSAINKAFLANLDRDEYEANPLVTMRLTFIDSTGHEYTITKREGKLHGAGSLLSWDEQTRNVTTAVVEAFADALYEHDLRLRP